VRIEDRNIYEISELVYKSLVGIVSEEEFSRLEQLLASDRKLREIYQDFLLIHIGLSWRDGVNIPVEPLLESTHTDDVDDPEAAKLLAEVIERDIQRREEREAEESRLQAEAKREEVKEAAEKAFAQFIEDERRRQEKLAYKQYKARQRWLIFGITTLAASLILVVTAWIFQEEKPEPVLVPVVAMLDETYNAKWDDPSTPIASGRELYAGPMKLLRGFAKITLNRGTSVIIRGPAEIELENERQVFLQQGTLTAMVPERDKGFVVRTRNAMIVDFGTEFGVIAYENGETEAHVFKGEVELRLMFLRVRWNYATARDESGRAERNGFLRARPVWLIGGLAFRVGRLILNQRILSEAWKLPEHQSL
jgi:hypothetical protein